jgi:hypothetical protein
MVFQPRDFNGVEARTEDKREWIMSEHMIREVYSFFDVRRFW